MSQPFSTTGIKFVLKSVLLCKTAEEEGKHGATVQEKGNENETPPRLFRVTHFSLVPVVKQISRIELV